MKDLLQRIRNMDDCKVMEPCGIPNLNLPDDLKEFYSLCGGVRLFEDKDYYFHISSPEELVPSNPAILPDGFEEDISEDDISNNFYIIARNGPEQAISINLGKPQFGYCYDSFWQIHATSESAIIALSFKSLLKRLLQDEGSYPYWLNSDFASLGYAYD